MWSSLIALTLLLSPLATSAPVTLREDTVARPQSGSTLRQGGKIVPPESQRSATFGIGPDGEADVPKIVINNRPQWPSHNLQPSVALESERPLESGYLFSLSKPTPPTTVRIEEDEPTRPSAHPTIDDEVLEAVASLLKKSGADRWVLIRVKEESNRPYNETSHAEALAVGLVAVFLLAIFLIEASARYGRKRHGIDQACQARSDLGPSISSPLSKTPPTPSSPVLDEKRGELPAYQETAV